MWVVSWSLFPSLFLSIALFLSLSPSALRLLFLLFNYLRSSRRSGYIQFVRSTRVPVNSQRVIVPPVYISNGRIHGRPAWRRPAPLSLPVACRFSIDPSHLSPRIFCADFLTCSTSLSLLNVHVGIYESDFKNDSVQLSHLSTFRTCARIC